MYRPEDQDLLSELGSIRPIDRMETLTKVQVEAILRNIKVASDLDRSSRKYSKALILLTIILIILTTGLIVLGFWTIKDSREQTSIQNNIALNSQFFTRTNTSIISALEQNQKILIEHGGTNTDADLDNYLGVFDVVQSSYEKGLLAEADLCDSFSYYINLTSKNVEVRNYINGQQKLDPNFYMSLNDLNTVISNSKINNCK